jgi:hypothetical protein
MMKKAIVLTVLLAVAALASTGAAWAKKKPKSVGGKATGVFCEQGGQNAHFPIKMFKPNQQAKMRKGQRAVVNIAGFGPVNCVVY